MKTLKHSLGGLMITFHHLPGGMEQGPMDEGMEDDKEMDDVAKKEMKDSPLKKVLGSKVKTKYK